jgi:hypothetical protein
MVGGRPRRKPDSVAVGDYPIDCKPCADKAEDGFRYPEGMLWLRAIRAPFQVPFGAIVPERVRGLLVPVALSATHVAYCALRLEPVWAALGQAAGTSAALSIHEDRDPGDVDVSTLQRALIDDGCKLTFFADLPTRHPRFRAIQHVALAGWVPADQHWRVRPDDPATWGDLVELVYAAWNIPQSVTSPHFVGIDAGDPRFIAVESLYDLGSRQGIAIFPNTHPPHYDSHFEFHRPESRTRWAELRLDDIPAPAEVVQFLTAVAHATGRAAPTPDPPSGAITRGEACALVAALVH